MIIPIRCFTCGKVLGHLNEVYNELLHTRTSEEALNDLKIHRYCCRRILLSTAVLIDRLLQYPNESTR